VPCKKKVAKIEETKYEHAVFGALGCQSTEVNENQNVKFRLANMPVK
jgi:hypothetical protein